MVQHFFEICLSVFKGILKSILEISYLFLYPLNPNPSPIQTQDRVIMYANAYLFKNQNTGQNRK